MLPCILFEELSQTQERGLVKKTSISLGYLRLGLLRRLSWNIFLEFDIQSDFERIKSTITQALIDSGSEVNEMHVAYAAKLGLTVRKINAKAQKMA